MSETSLTLSPPQDEYSQPEFTITSHLAADAGPTVVFQGKMRLETTDEAPIAQLFGRIVDQASPTRRVILDLRRLSFMNSRGISALFKFAIALRGKQVSLHVLAVESSVWQQAHLNTIPKISPDSIITWLEVED
ncbi:MAG: STAS domain-containing protein [Anaerolineae bacterium]|nr:STAS domain-containing protein [Anaerolineae bacterium]